MDSGLTTTFTREIELSGFSVIDAYFDSPGERLRQRDRIALLIQDITALNLTTDRAGIRNLLELVPSIRNLAQSQEIRSLVEPILGERARVVRGIFFDKQPNANWKVPWHQDLTIAVKNRLEVPDFHPWSVKERSRWRSLP